MEFPFVLQELEDYYAYGSLAGGLFQATTEQILAHSVYFNTCITNTAQFGLSTYHSITESLAFLEKSDVVSVGEEWNHITHLFMALQHVNALILAAVAWDCIQQYNESGLWKIFEPINIDVFELNYKVKCHAVSILPIL